MAGRIINYHGGEKIYDRAKADELLALKQDVLTIDTTVNIASTNPVENKGIAEAIRAEETERVNADDVLDGRIGNLSSLTTVAKTDAVSAINELNDAKLSKSEVDTALSDTSINPVQNKIVTEAIEDLLDKVEADNVPTEGSTKLVRSGGTWDAIRFASVKVGETMFWPQHIIETRTVVSDSPFTYEFNGVTRTVTPNTPVMVELEIADNVPDGWRACDGTAVLDVIDYPELAEFFGSANITVDDKIWIPYCAKHIIKIEY